MKYLTFVILILFFLPNLIWSQQSRPCNNYPTKEEIMSHLSTRPGGGLNYRVLNSCNYDSSVKNRLLYLLDWEWTQNEINTHAEKEFKKIGYPKIVDDYASKKAKGNDSIYKAIRDSYAIEVKKKLVPEMRVLDEVVYAVGQMDIKEAIPQLRKALYDTLHYDIESVELALARLGDKELETRILNRYKYNPKLKGQDWVTEFGWAYGKYTYIASQESYYCYHEWLDTSKMYNQLDDNYKADVKCAYNVILRMYYWILNEDLHNYLQINFKFPYETTTNNELILYCRNWLIANKGKYIIRRHS